MPNADVLRLYYFKAPHGNFGDDLNLWLWPQMLPDLVDIADPLLVVPGGGQAADPAQPLLLGVGTVLNHWVPSEPKKIVLGAGSGYGPPPTLDSSWTIEALRGPRTAEALGCSTVPRLGDPATLVPELWSGPSGRRGVSFIPHHGRIGCAPWAPLCRTAGMRFVDPRRTVDEVVGAIASSELVISESLHGAIIADAFRVPWIPVKLSSRVLSFKWEDWCAAMGLAYDPAVGPPLQRPISLRTRARNASRVPELIRFLSGVRRRGRPLMSTDDDLRACVDGLQAAVAAVQESHQAG